MGLGLLGLGRPGPGVVEAARADRVLHVQVAVGDARLAVAVLQEGDD